MSKKDKKTPIVALMYDFDKTLSTKDMQEYGFIPSLGMSPSEFWSETVKLANKENMDSILAYLYLMVKKASEKGMPVTYDMLFSLGKGVQYYPGVEDWFERINEYGRELGVTVEHYVISSGQKEIIDGSSISKYFKKIYACEFLYGNHGEALWPKMCVNYTNKTQFLFRINKGVLDVCDDININKYIRAEERRVPFPNMIYIGDGLTDVPCMTLVKLNKGQSIAVYKEKDTAARLMAENRVDFITEADYRKDSELDHIVKTIISKMSIVNELERLHDIHKRSVEETRRNE